MKKKISRIMGLSLAFVLVVSMLVFAIPVSAGPYDDLAPATANTWVGFGTTAGAAPPGLWFYDPSITKVGPIAEALDGDLYAFVQTETTAVYRILTSADGGRTWAESQKPGYYTGGPVIDMVCSSKYEDVIYVTDGNYVFKSIDGATSFAIVAEDSLETVLLGVCGPAVHITDYPITCLDVGYNGSDEPLVFIGVEYTFANLGPSVLYINEAGYPSAWTDLGLHCYGANGALPGGYMPYSVGVAPNFATSKKTYVAVSTPWTAYLTFGATYTDAVATDIGKQVVGSSGDAGTLYAYDNATKTWMVRMYNSGDLFDNGAETITITGGSVGARTMVGVAVIRDNNTHIIYTTGITCSWNEVSELLWDCDATKNFDIIHASRFAFSTSYASNSLMFIGVVDAFAGICGDPHSSYGQGGDVYRTQDTPGPDSAIDLNVRGFSSGCLGYFNANICSLDIKAGDALLAGAWDCWDQDPTNVYYSNDGGWTWSESKKDPTGEGRTWVLWYEDTALAGTWNLNRCDCALSMSCGTNVGEFFNQISLIDMEIDETLDMSHAPGYLDGSTTMYVLTLDKDTCPVRGDSKTAIDNTNLLRWDGTNWERVFSSFSYVVPVINETIPAWMDWVEVSPDFNETGCVYLANINFHMFRSMDEGCSWKMLTFPCEPRPSISAWIVVDSETVLAAGSDRLGFAGTIFKTTYHGTQPWTEAKAKLACDGVDFDLSPNVADDSTVLFGDACGKVYISKDLADTWDGIADAAHTFDKANTYVIFDPDYGTNDMIYAAAGTDIWRCAIDSAKPWPKQAWVNINNKLCEATGIAAEGDTALYVSDGGGTSGATVRKVTATGQVSVEWSGELGLYMQEELGVTISLPLEGTIDLIDKTITHEQGEFNDGELITHISDVLTSTGFNRYWAIGFEDIDRTPGDWAWLESWSDHELIGKVFKNPDVEIEIGILDYDTSTFTPDAIAGTSGTYDPITGYFTLDAYYVDSDTGDDMCPTLSFTSIGVNGYAYIFLNYYTSPITHISDFYGECSFPGVIPFFPTLAFPFPAVSGTIGVRGSYTGATGDITLDDETVWLPVEVWQLILENWSYIDDTSLENWFTGVVHDVVSTNLITDVTPGAAGASECLVGVWRTLNPMDPMVPALVEFEFLELAPSVKYGTSLLKHDDWTDWTDDLWLTAGSNMLWVLDKNNPTRIWMWDDTLATPVIGLTPASGAKLVTTSSATLTWTALDGATKYELALYSYCPACPDQKQALTPIITPLTCYTVEGLVPGTKYYWKVRVASGFPFLSKWSAEQTFETAIGSTTELKSPYCGQEGVSRNPNFSWDAVPGASGYEVEVSTTEDFASPVASGTTTVNAFGLTTALDYSTTYYWRVRATKDGVVGAWSVCLFTTESVAVTPTTTTTTLEVTQNEITPMWIWVIIGIGAALVIAVIVLIVTTRRVA